MHTDKHSEEGMMKMSDKIALIFITGPTTKCSNALNIHSHLPASLWQPRSCSGILSEVNQIAQSGEH
jgi:hypothetical protein